MRKTTEKHWTMDLSFTTNFGEDDNHEKDKNTNDNNNNNVSFDTLQFLNPNGSEEGITTKDVQGTVEMSVNIWDCIFRQEEIPLLETHKIKTKDLFREAPNIKEDYLAETTRKQGRNVYFLKRMGLINFEDDLEEEKQKKAKIEQRKKEKEKQLQSLARRRSLRITTLTSKEDITFSDPPRLVKKYQFLKSSKKKQVSDPNQQENERDEKDEIEEEEEEEGEDRDNQDVSDESEESDEEGEESEEGSDEEEENSEEEEEECSNDESN